MKPTPFKTIEEALDAYETSEEFRDALVDDLHSGRKRFSLLGTYELMEACDINVGSDDGISPGMSNEGFCISLKPSNRRAFLRDDELNWKAVYTYRITGKNGRKIRFQSWHGMGGVCEYVKGPYLYRSRKGSRERMLKIYAPKPKDTIGTVTKRGNYTQIRYTAEEARQKFGGSLFIVGNIAKMIQQNQEEEE